MSELLPISNRVERIKAGNDPEMLVEMHSGYAILGKYQPAPLTGCCMLLPNPVVGSPNELDESRRRSFFSDLVLLGDAIMQVTGSTRINYLVLCNQVPELHGHCIPRFDSEDPSTRMQGPFEAYNFANARIADARGQDHALHASLRDALVGLLASRSVHENSRSL